MRQPIDLPAALRTLAAGTVIVIAGFVGALSLAALLSGCTLSSALSGSADSQTQSTAPLEDVRVAEAYAALAAARSTAAALLQRGSITVADAERVQTAADAVRTGLDQARLALKAGRSGDYTAQLGQALVLLAALETNLKEKSR